jgi:hypothetical protein
MTLCSALIGDPVKVAIRHAFTSARMPPVKASRPKLRAAAQRAAEREGKGDEASQAAGVVMAPLLKDVSPRSSACARKRERERGSARR